MGKIPMHRDDGDIWPSDAPIGTFDIEMGGVTGYAATAHIIFVCPNARRCAVLLGPTFVDRSEPGRQCVWGWDGNADSPTLTPSINCLAEKDGKPTGGCGWHGHITRGEMI
jgi:hypothetical protein